MTEYGEGPSRPHADGWGESARGRECAAGKSTEPFDRGCASMRGPSRLGTLLLSVAGAAVLGALPFLHVMGGVSAHLRRLTAELSHAPVAYQGSAVVSAAAAMLLAAVGLMMARALTRRGGWMAALLLMTFTAAMASAYLWRITARDAEGETSVRSVAWSRDLGALNVTFDDMTLVSGSRDGHFFGAVRNGPRGYEVFDSANGQPRWTGESNAHHPLSGERGMLFTAEGSDVVARRIESGEVAARFTAPDDIETVFRLDQAVVLELSSGELMGLDGDLKPRWTGAAIVEDLPVSKPMPRGGKGLPAGRATVVPAFPDGIVVSDEHGLRMIDARTGAMRWRRDEITRGVLRVRTLGDRLLLVSADGVDVLSPATGEGRQHLTLPTAGRPDQAEPVDFTPLDGDRMLVSRGDSLYALDGTGGVVWMLRTGDDVLRLHEQGPGVFFVETRSGKLLGVEAATGHITWEWWRGGFYEHACPPERAPLVFVQGGGHPMVQEGPGAPLLLIDSRSGHLARRVPMPPGLRVRRLVDDGRQLVILGRDANDHAILLAVPRPPEMQAPAN